MNSHVRANFDYCSRCFNCSVRIICPSHFGFRSSTYCRPATSPRNRSKKSCSSFSNYERHKQSFCAAIYGRHIDLRRVAFICLGAALGIPLGAYFLSILSSNTIKLVLASLAIPLAILLMLRFSYHFTRESLGCAVAGFLGGALVTTTGVPGPPIVLFLLNQDLVKEKFVGTCAAIFLFMALATFGAHASLSLIDTTVLVQAAIIVPAIGLGTYTGDKMLSRLKPMLFKRIAAGIVIASATAILINVTAST